MRKWISIFLAAAVFLSLAAPVSAKEKADVTISTAEEFLAFAENRRLDSFSKELTVSLEADIDLSGTDFGGIPIFCGTFLGNGHTVSGLELNAHGSEQGCFRYLTQTAVVQQLHVTGKIAPQGSRGNVGGIAGHNAGVIKDCSFTGEISGGDRVGGIVGSNAVSGVIEGCRTEGSVHADHFVGGIAGENAGVIRSCENAASVNTTPQQNSVDISDITIGTITGTESAGTVTDIGGIAGLNSGTLRNCENTGDVGYKHMGYNIGGITGSHTGYLVSCENYGAVSGRKEVGGIVGHMEPSILISYETDTLQILQAQLEVLSDLTDRAVGNAQSNTGTIRALVMQLENYTADAEEAVDFLLNGLEDYENLDPDSYIAALQTLSNSFSGMGTTLRSLAQAVQDTGDDLSRDLQAVSDQIGAIEATLETGEENLGGTVSDISDADTAEDLTGKVAAADNYGAVLGDLNVGGIVGAMALENDLDPEEDVQVNGSVTFNAAGKLRSVVRDCTNGGAVTAKKQNAGGIVGWQSLGLVKNCINSGALESVDYAGGIAGQSLGYIRESYAKCTVDADSFVRGIAGSGTVVTDCRSMVKLSGSERVGAVLGFAEENHTDVQQPILGNLYACADGDPGAIDGISYDALAQSAQWKDFMALEGLPKLFKTAAVTFVFEDGTTEIVRVTPGNALPQEKIPAIPVKTGYTGRWEGLDSSDLEKVLFDMSFEAAYTAYGTVIGAEETHDGKVVLLLQGDFAPDAAITLTVSETTPVLAEEETLLEAVRFTVTGCEKLTAARYLLPESTGKTALYVHTENGEWKSADYTVDGSYLVLAVEQGADGIALVQQNTTLSWGWIAIGTAGILAVALVTVLYGRKRKKAETREPEEN